MGFLEVVFFFFFKGLQDMLHLISEGENKQASSLLFSSGAWSTSQVLKKHLWKQYMYEQSL